jgi:hypothetical protein
MTIARKLPWPLFVAAALYAAPALAEDDSAVIADSLFREGHELFQAGNHADACVKFDRSQKLDPKLNTLLNLALCHQEIGRTATAWAEFTSAAAAAKRDGRTKREEFANERAEALHAVLSTVVLKVEALTPGMAVSFDGRQVATGVLGVPYPVDPGTHTVSATAPGAHPWSNEVQIGHGPTSVIVNIPVLGDVLGQVTPVAPPPPRPAPIPPEPGPADAIDDDDGGVSPLVYVGFGIGGAGLLLGAITGGLALGKWGEISDSCVDDVCPPGSQDTIDSANTLANVSNVGFVIGALGVGVGVVGLVLSGSDDSGDNLVARVQLDLLPAGLGLSGRF